MTTLYPISGSSVRRLLVTNTHPFLLIFALLCCFTQNAFGSTVPGDPYENAVDCSDTGSQVTPQSATTEKQASLDIRNVAHGRTANPVGVRAADLAIEPGSLPLVDRSGPQTVISASEEVDFLAENAVAQDILQKPILQTSPVPVPENDYGNPRSSSGSMWLSSMGWVIVFILVTVIVGPLALGMYTNITPFVVGGALGGLVHEIERGGRKYTSAAVSGAAIGFLTPLAIALIGPIGIYYFAGRPLLHSLGDADAVLCCTKSEHWRLDKLKVSPDGRWLALATDAPEPVFSEKTLDNLVYLIDLKSARFVDWPGTSSVHYKEIPTSKGTESLGGMIDITFDAEKGGLLAYYGSEYINETRIKDVQRIKTNSLGLKNLQLAGTDPQILLRYQILAQVDNRFDVQDQQNGDRFSINASPGWERYEISGDGRVLALIHPGVDSGSSPWAFLSSIFVGRWEVEFWDLEQRKLIKRYTQYLFDTEVWINKKVFTKQHITFLHGTPDGRRWFLTNSQDKAITIFDLSNKVGPALSLRAGPPTVAAIAAM